MALLLVTETDGGRSFHVILGDELEIRLSENPMTGFRWTCAVDNQSLLTLTSETFEILSDGAVGVGGVRCFRFASIGDGTCEILTELQRGKDPAEQVIKYRINVVGKS